MWQMCFNAFDQDANLDVLDHPILNFIYFVVSSSLEGLAGPSELCFFVHTFFFFFKKLCSQFWLYFYFWYLFACHEWTYPIFFMCQRWMLKRKIFAWYLIFLLPLCNFKSWTAWFLGWLWIAFLACIKNGPVEAIRHVFFTWTSFVEVLSVARISGVFISYQVGIDNEEACI